ncbi:MAG: hypothetical protein ABIY51_08850 [Ferruginibacter sp.]
MNKVLKIKMGEIETRAWFEEIFNRHHCMYKVFFENGYENIFFTDVETGKWIEEDLGFSELAQMIGSGIRPFMRQPVHVPKMLTWHKQHMQGKLVSFGFVGFLKGNHKMYEIYNSNKKYLYTLVEMENEEWQIMGNSSMNIQNLDSKFIQHVVEVLPLYSLI